MTKETNQQWGGRFTEPTDAFVARFTASINFDQRMYRQDIQGSVAHAKMLTEAGVLNAQECSDIERGLAEIQTEIERRIPIIPGSFKNYFNKRDENGKLLINTSNASLFLSPTVPAENRKINRCFRHQKLYWA